MQVIEVKMLVDLYSEKEEEVDGEIVVNNILLKEDQIVRKLTILENLYPEEVFNSEGEILKDRVRVYDDTIRDSYVISGSYDKLKKRILNKKKAIGF